MLRWVSFLFSVGVGHGVLKCELSGLRKAGVSFLYLTIAMIFNIEDQTGQVFCVHFTSLCIQI